MIIYNQWKGEDATKAYFKCAEIEKLNKSGDAAEYYLEASNMQKKYNTSGILTLLTWIIN